MTPSTSNNGPWMGTSSGVAGGQRFFATVHKREKLATDEHRFPGGIPSFSAISPYFFSAIEFG